MLRLRCIGGPNDREIVEFDHGQTSCRLISRRPAQGAYRGSLAPQTELAEVTIYTLRKVLFSEGASIPYLAPIDWDDARALVSVLAP